MKSQIAGIFFYILYFVAMVRPIVPVLEYHVNKDYIVSVLCENRNKPALACNGKCYLKKQMHKAYHVDHDEDNHNHDHTGLPEIDMSKYPVSLLDFAIIQIKRPKTSLENPSFARELAYFNLIYDLDKPPIS
ncbi:hypothetical protein [Aureivirga sp. CE67]|uniref:hypothetical protein n=1 Tax=Aureivirga sp. CE67 TaxID=1788983 RepID=UPI0018C974F5|nr:hypothetical protein [Aureivirga sp. CE67]